MNYVAIQRPPALSRLREYGSVTSAKVMMDRYSGQSKGFGFAEMATDEQAQAAIRGMNGRSTSTAWR